MPTTRRSATSPAPASRIRWCARPHGVMTRSFRWRYALPSVKNATVVAQGQRPPEEEWVLLAYRLPRVPSTPRITVWRKLKRLGVVQVADGVVALPADARTREALEWIASEVVDHSGEATVWLGRPADRAARTALAARMTAAVDREYDRLVEEIAALPAGDDS